MTTDRGKHVGKLQGAHLDPWKRVPLHTEIEFHHGLPEPEALNSLYSTIDRIEYAVRHRLEAKGYSGRVGSLLARAAHEDLRGGSPKNLLDSSGVRITNELASEEGAQEIPNDVRDLVLSMLFLNVVHGCVSNGHAIQAVEAMFHATFFAIRGEADMTLRDHKKAKATDMGARNKNTPKNVRVRKVYDAYLRGTPPLPGDGATGVAQRAFHKLRADWRLEAKQSTEYGRNVESRLSPCATKVVRRLFYELRSLGWKPSKDYRSIRNHQVNKE